VKNLLNFLVRYHAFLLFLFLEIVCLTFIIRFNNFQRVKFFNSSNHLSGAIYQDYQSIVEYFKLRNLNNSLAEENAKLREELQVYKFSGIEKETNNAIHRELFHIIPAKVINNSVNKQYNYITLNRGRRDGVKPDMGVVSEDGVVGVIVNVSDHFSTALSILNSRWAINAKLASTNHFGPLHWDGKNPYIATLDEIPYHVQIEVDEEVVTSGYSSIFPEGILIGRVVKIDHNKGENFQRMLVQLASDFNNLYYVDIVESKNKQERLTLEKDTQDE
jgi:rod shape-determining protein MreC